MLREQERALRYQVRSLEDEDEKSLYMIQLSVAALAGGVALATVLLRSAEPLPSTTLFLVSAAAGLNILSLVLVVDAYIGFRNPADAYVGPSPTWIAEKVQEDGWTLNKHLLAQIEKTPLFFEYNAEIADRAMEKRRRGIYALLASLITYAGGYIYILTKVITT